MIYPKHILYVFNETVIAIRYIESITLFSGEEHTVDILKNDLRITVSMISGKEYEISMLNQKKYNGDRLNDYSASEICYMIYDKWQHSMKET